MNAELVIRPATASDFAEIAQLLELVELPALHLEEANVRFHVAYFANELLGCMGLESHGRAWLLRSVAVHPAQRRSGFGRRLVERALQLTRAAEVDELVLLTQSAAPFFQALGFQPIERAAVDSALLDSWEFRHHKCDEAQVLRRLSEGQSGTTAGR